MNEATSANLLLDQRESGSSHSNDLAYLTEVVRSFGLPDSCSVQLFAGRGNINLTYLVVDGPKEYLLQKVNSEVFTMPHRVMNSMLASIEAQRSALQSGLGDPTWQAIELISTPDGSPFLEMKDDWSVWRLMVRIPEVVSFKSLDAAGERMRQLELAEETGKGLGIYTDLTSSMEPVGVEGSLPGYRDTGLYYRQFRSVLARNRTFEQASQFLPQDPILKSATENHFLVTLTDDELDRRQNEPEILPFIQIVKDREAMAMSLWEAVSQGSIPRTLIHGDTKLENFLFDAHSYRVRSLVDLDTVMAFTWLADWGDMIRSLVNVAGECEPVLSKIKVDQEVYEAVARGFLRTANKITDAEVELMPLAVRAITLELGMRFLTDYLRGDTYFRLLDGDPKDLNRTRGMVQLTLLRELEKFEPTAKEMVWRLRGQV